MRRTSLALLCVSVISIAPASARAQAALDPQSCETISTVRCTGAAAPLALPTHAPLIAPPAVAPQPPAAAAPVPAAPPPAAYPPAPLGCEACPPPAEAAPTPWAGPALAGSVGPGFKLVLDERGQLAYERRKKGTTPGVWGPGLALWLVSYLGTSIGGVADAGPYAAIPFFGGFVYGGFELIDGNLGKGIGYSVGGAMQLSGFVMFLVGLSAGKDKIDRIPVRVSPLAYREGGGGFAVAARF
jgi:hypothetical protein